MTQISPWCTPRTDDRDNLIYPLCYCICTQLHCQSKCCSLTHPVTDCLLGGFRKNKSPRKLPQLNANTLWATTSREETIIRHSPSVFNALDVRSLPLFQLQQLLPDSPPYPHTAPLTLPCESNRMTHFSKRFFMIYKSHTENSSSSAVRYSDRERPAVDR